MPTMKLTNKAPLAMASSGGGRGRVDATPTLAA